MAILNIRNLSDATHHRLRLRAARRGRSMEAEARAILEHATADDSASIEPPEALQAWFAAHLGGRVGTSMTDELIAERRAEFEAELEP